MLIKLLIIIFFGIFTVYDITKRSSFLSLERWIEEVRRYAATNVLLVLVGELQQKKKNKLFKIEVYETFFNHFR